MIVADDRHIICGEPHGSCAQWVYAACSRNPRSLDELDKLLPEFGADGNLRELLGCGSDLTLEPYDAGLIVVDLAKKWIYAKDSYFGAHRRGVCHPRDDNKSPIEYEFSKEWQFVAEAKWFRYLQGSGLKSYVDPGTAFSFDDEEFPWDDEEPSHVTEAESSEPDEDDYWDSELSSINALYANRVCTLVDFKPQNAAEERDLQTLEHINRYDEEAARAEHRLGVEKKAIVANQIELQAAENLWRRTGEPRWELKRIRFQAHIGRCQKHLSRFEEDQSEAGAMAAELRTLLTTENARAMLKKLEEMEKTDATIGDADMPF
jgi:hypothetical protein